MRVFKVSGFLQVLLLCIGTPLNSKYVNEERLVAAVGTRDKLKLLQTWCSIIYKWCSLLMAKLETVSKKLLICSLSAIAIQRSSTWYLILQVAIQDT